MLLIALIVKVLKPLKRLSTSGRLHTAMSQKAVIFVIIPNQSNISIKVEPPSIMFRNIGQWPNSILSCYNHVDWALSPWHGETTVCWWSRRPLGKEVGVNTPAAADSRRGLALRHGRA